MARTALQEDVFNLAIDRMVKLYEENHQIVCSFSGGKDSTICLEICIIAATMTDRLPVQVVMRDEEITQKLDPQLESLRVVWQYRTIPNLYEMLKLRQKREQYEQCAVIRDIIMDKQCQNLLKSLQMR